MIRDNIIPAMISWNQKKYSANNLQLKMAKTLSISIAERFKEDIKRREQIHMLNNEIIYGKQFIAIVRYKFLWPISFRFIYK